MDEYALSVTWSQELIRLLISANVTSVSSFFQSIIVKIANIFLHTSHYHLQLDRTTDRSCSVSSSLTFNPP